mgnify:CR=1 FL=1
MLPDAIQNAAAAFDSLPGIGPRAALRYAYWMISQPKETIQRFARSIDSLAFSITSCSLCHQWAETNPCLICGDPKRDPSALCVVALSPDIRVVEETGVFRGRYHVLGGTLDPMEGRSPDQLTIRQLLDRLHEPSSTIREIILALDTDVAGDTTALFLKKHLEILPIKVTRLARGLPTGALLEYADPDTLANALTNRKET